MGAFFESTAEKDENGLLAPKLRRLHGQCVTRRIEELEAIVTSLRDALAQAEDDLRKERERTPVLGDFVRCPLTNFFGQVTKVTPRPYGRPWVEIVPYLGKDLPGHRTMDLYDSWELIDPPSQDWGEKPEPEAEPGHLPSVSSFTFAHKAEPTGEDEALANEIEVLLDELWTNADRTKNTA